MAAVEIGMLADVPPGTARAFAVQGTAIAVFNIDGDLYALDDTCSHAEASLSEGEIDPDELCVECPLHGSQFDLQSGLPRTLPAFEPVQVYKVWHEGDKLFLEFPA